MALSKDEEFRLTQEMLYNTPTVEVKVDMAGNLCIDKMVVIHDFVRKVGGSAEAVRIEVCIMRAIEKAERLTKEKLNKPFGR